MKYRILKEGEKIRAGDEFRFNKKSEWKLCEGTIGYVVKDAKWIWSISKIRRHIKEKKILKHITKGKR